MCLFAWVTPAFVKGAPVDHTWVTTYDSRVTPYYSLAAAQAAGEHYWFSLGTFHPQGTSSEHLGGMILVVPAQASSYCLVLPDDASSKGCIHWYGIDGVCHQLSNQILYPSGVRVDSARGYRLSSSIFGTFGRQTKEWDIQRMHCQVLLGASQRRRPSMSLLYRRAMYFYRGESRVPFQLEAFRRQLLEDIDSIGFAARGPQETANDRVGALNQRIMKFVKQVSETLDNQNAATHLLGVDSSQEINLIDPELFVFPDVALRLGN